MSDTPRTENQIRIDRPKCNDGMEEAEFAWEFARKLEREIAELKEQMEDDRLQAEADAARYEWEADNNE